jgi:hypothetical protein
MLVNSIKGYGYEARPVPNMVQGPFGLGLEGYVNFLRRIPLVAGQPNDETGFLTLALGQFFASIQASSPLNEFP